MSRTKLALKRSWADREVYEFLHVADGYTTTLVKPHCQLAFRLSSSDRSCRNVIHVYLLHWLESNDRTKKPTNGPTNERTIDGTNELNSERMNECTELRIHEHSKTSESTTLSPINPGSTPLPSPQGTRTPCLTRRTCGQADLHSSPESVPAQPGSWRSVLIDGSLKPPTLI